MVKTLYRFILSFFSSFILLCAQSWDLCWKIGLPPVANLWTEVLNECLWHFMKENWTVEPRLKGAAHIQIIYLFRKMAPTVHSNWKLGQKMETIESSVRAWYCHDIYYMLVMDRIWDTTGGFCSISLDLYTLQRLTICTFLPPPETAVTLGSILGTKE